MDRHKATFIHFAYHSTDPSQLSKPFLLNMPVEEQTNSFVTFIVEDRKNRMWIGSWTGGLNVYDRVDGIMKHFEYGVESITGLPTNHIWDLFETKDGSIFFNNGSMVFKLNEEVNQFPYHDIKSLLDDQSLNFTCIIEGNNEGEVWLGSKDHGLFRYNPGDNKIKSFQHDPNDSKSLSANDVIGIQQDQDGFNWISTTNGLNRYDPSRAEFERFQYKPEEDESLSYHAGINSIRPIFQDSKKKFGYLHTVRQKVFIY
ncbi:MAG: hypothetical protein IPL46_30850 [Saprospiraceae bacterium]|nr:hypothetical protein [Saprospiraceae bacterium]